MAKPRRAKGEHRLYTPHMDNLIDLFLYTASQKPHRPIQQTNSPVTRLPVEVLSLILLYHRHPEFPDEDSTWLQILRVCRQWRTVAMGCPLMWTNVTTDNRLLRPFMLKQSKGTPIVLRRMRFVPNLSRGEKKIVTQNLHRIRKLELLFEDCTQKEVAEWLKKLLSPDAAPVLQALELAVLRGDHYTIPISEVPPDFESLTLDDILLTFPEDRMQESLTTFSISPSVDLPEMLTYLRKTLPVMPNLSYLHICHTSFGMDFTRQDAFPSMVLPRLERLRCSGSIITCLSILRMFRLSTNTRLDIRISGRYGRERLPDPLYAAISQAFHHRQGAHSAQGKTTYDVHSLVRFFRGEYSDTFAAHRVLVYETPNDSHPGTLSNFPSGSSYPERLPVLLFQVDIGANGVVVPTPDYLSGILEIFRPPSRVSATSLRMHSNSLYDVGTGPFGNTFFSNHRLTQELSFLTCSGVRSLYIGDLGTALCIIPYLGQRKDANSEAPSVPSSSSDLRTQSTEFLTFPNLETLVLGDLSPDTSSSIQGIKDAETAAVQLRVVMQQLQSAVEDRARAGRRLKKLRMHVVATDEVSGAWVEMARNRGWAEEISCVDQDAQNGGLGSNPLDGVGRYDEED